MYIRPQLRVNDDRDRVRDRETIKIPPDTYLYNLMYRGQTDRPMQTVRPVYQKEAYLKLLKQNYEDYGLVFKDPNIPDYVEHVTPPIEQEPTLTYSDWVYMKLRILKSGVVRIKLETSFASMDEKYYSKNKTPPLKVIMQAYKSMDFSDKFLENLKNKYEKKVLFAKKVGPAIDAIFNKEPVVKKKKKIEEPEVEQEADVEHEDEEEEEEAVDDEGMDIEVDEDPEDLAQDDEEVYISDGDA